MFRKRFYYLIRLQYLGFRFHGWQKQPDNLTVERMVERTLKYVLGRNNFKLLAAGRTDAKVSANETYIELFLDEEPLETNTFLSLFNDNLPQDVKALSIKEVTADFNIIQHPKMKEYLYLFSFGPKNHPFCAPFMVYIKEHLDIELMQQGAKLLEGDHDFKKFCYKPNPETQTKLTIGTSEIVKNDVFTANFFPESSYIYKVRGEGFKRYQVRLMMGALFDLGCGKLPFDDFKKLLNPDCDVELTHIAQASGLMLNKVEFIDD